MPSSSAGRDEAGDSRGDEHRRVRLGRALHQAQIGQDVAAERALAVQAPTGAQPAGRRRRATAADRGAVEVGDEPAQRRPALGDTGDEQPQPGDADERRRDQPPDRAHWCTIGVWGPSQVGVHH